MADSLTTNGCNGGSEKDKAPRLSPRERDVLRFIAGGVRSSDIADRLQISAQAVGTHRRDIMRKLGLRTIAELTRYAVREGLVEP